MSETAPEPLLARVWEDFTSLNPDARSVHDLLAARGERVVNDHIALRTFDDPRVSIDVVARPFVAAGYRAAGSYDFPQKHLRARHYEHRDGRRPKIFVSALELGQLPVRLQETVARLLEQLPEGITARSDFATCGRPWRLSLAEYEALQVESEYAAWVAAFGFCANHFTVSFNHLRTFPGLAELNHFLVGNGFELNLSGGEIKGSAAELLEQSATRASIVPVRFCDGSRSIPGGYYEFARRYPLPDGSLFEGFIARSADRLFESTDRR